MASPKLVWTELHDQALLKLTGLPVFSPAMVQASLPEDGARIRLAVGEICYIDGELFQAADPDGSMDLNGVLTRTGEWVGLTWSVRKRTPRKWPHPQLLRAGTACNSALLPAMPVQATTPASDAQQHGAVLTAPFPRLVDVPQRNELACMHSQMGLLSSLPADCNPRLPEPSVSQKGSDDDRRSDGCVDVDATRSSDCSEVVQGLRESDMERRLEAMGSIAGILEILPHIDMQAGCGTSLATSMVHDGTVDALVGIVRGDSGGAVLEVTSACQVLQRTHCATVCNELD
eukprot:COSAG02_NODE_2603_length_8445_cov_5.416247_7_plen_288_part_00